MKKALFTGFLFCFAAIAQAGVNVWTHHNDNNRTGANLSETQLTPANVNSATFGKLWDYEVDSSIYAQPLIIQNVAIPGLGVHNLLLVATMNNTVFAFDADNNAGANLAPLWQTSFNDPAAGVVPVRASDVETWASNIDFLTPIGILSTPVVDTTTNTLYVLARTRENGTYVQKLHALDITTGAERSNSPVKVTASVPGTGYDAVNSVVTFNAMTQNQRAALGLSNGKVLIAWASHVDIDPYHGWVLEYDASSLQQTGVFNTTAGGSRGGIWQSGDGPAFDTSGHAYYAVGNGTYDGVSSFGQSILKLNILNGLTLQDWFVPDNNGTLSDQDLDIGVSGPVLIPNTQLALNGSKTGMVYVMNTAMMGRLVAGNSQLPQSSQLGVGHIHGAPVYYPYATAGPLFYMWSETDYLKGYVFNGSTLNTTPATQSSFMAPPGMPGGFLSVSANGSHPGTGLVWASIPYRDDAEYAVVKGILRVFNASNLSTELWDSEQVPGRDSVGNFAKYSPPTVANGKVYLATFSNKVRVYGLLASQAAAPKGSIAGSSVASSAAVNLTTTGGSDWAHWPNYVHKAGGGSQISDFTALYPILPTTTYTSDPRAFSWTDGAPTGAGNVTTGVSVSGYGGGFQIVAPADPTSRTLNVYVGGTNSTGRMRAYLSDGSTEDFVDVRPAATGAYYLTYTFTYQSGNPGQVLYVEWTQVADAGNVTLAGATLIGGTTSTSPPATPIGVRATQGASTTSVTVSWTAVSGATNYTVYRSTTSGTQGTSLGTSNTANLTDTSVVAGTTYYYSVVASNASGSSSPSAQASGFAAVVIAVPSTPTGVSATQGTSASGITVSWSAVNGATSYSIYRSSTAGAQGSSVGSSSTASFTDTSVVAGKPYYYSVLATNSAGSSALSAQVSGYSIAIQSGGGALTGTGLGAVTTANLTAVGSSDWVHWPEFTRKASGATQISNYAVVGTGNPGNYGDAPLTLSWSDGTPTATGSATTGLYLSGIGNGYLITLPADTNPRQFTIYVGGWNSGGTLTAHLSDGSATDFVDSSYSSTTGQYQANYTLTYRAAAAGQTLTVKWVQASGSTGNVVLDGAALAGVTASTIPATPTGVSATQGTSSSNVKVSWSVVTGASSYSIYRSTTSGTQGTSVGTSASASFTDSSVTGGTTYYYSVTASNSSGTSSVSSQVSGFASVATAPPAAPSGVTATQGTSPTSVTVNWSASTGATGYTVYRSAASGSQGASVGTSTTISYTDSSVVAGTTYYYSIVAANTAGSSAPSAQATGFATAQSTGLNGTSTGTLTTANLTTVGSSDWVHWPELTRKSSGASQISNYAVVGSGNPNTYGDAPLTLTWTDGTPTATGNATTGLYFAGIGNGYKITVPADTTSRQLTLYVGGWNSGGTLTAHLSDGSAPDFSNSSYSSTTGQYQADYTLTYHAASAGQTLTVTWVQTAGATGNVVLDAAALAGGAPVTTPTAPTGVTATQGTSNTSVTVSWSAVTGAATYTVYRSTTSGTQGSAVGTPTTASFTDSSVLAGTIYYYSVVATNSAGSSAASAQVSGFAVQSAGGNLAGVGLGNLTTTNLTAIGSSDWVHWPEFTQKASGGSQISNYSVVGSGNPNTYGDAPVTFSWTDGNLTTNSSVTSGLYLAGVGNGYKINVPADTASRQLTLYVGGWNSAGKLTAHLSDGSAADFTDSSYSSTTGQYQANYTLTYHAASAGQTLSVTWVQTAGATGNVVLDAAALAGGGPPVTIPTKPAGVSATQGTSTTGVTVTWTAVSGATSYTIYRSTTSGTQGTSVGTATTASYTDASAVPGTTYYYSVSATNSAGSSTASTQVSGFASVAATIPTAPTGVSATQGTSTTSVKVSWTIVSGAATYKIYRSTTSGAQGASVGTATTGTYTDSSVVAGTTYFYSVVASNSAGSSAPSTQASGFASVPVTIPATPTGVSATQGTSTSNVKITWTVVTGATSYTIYRSIVSGTQGASVGTATTGTYTDSTVVSGTTYFYSVVSSNSAGASPASTQVSGFATVQSTGLMGASSNNLTTANLTAVGTSDWAHWPELTRKASGGSQISNYSLVGSTGARTYDGAPLTLTWSDGAPTANGSAATGLYVPGVGNGYAITVPADTNSRQLTVYVGGWNSGGTLTAHLSDGSATDFTDSSYSSTAQYEANYTLTYHAASAGQSLVVTWVQNAGATGNVVLDGAALAGGVPVTIPAVPTGVAASQGTSNSSVTVRWTPVNGAGTYTVYRSVLTGTQGNSIGNAATASYSDSNVVGGTLYYYSVVASNSAGSSAPSAQVSGFATASTAGTLAGAAIGNLTTANLTAVGTVDWIHWPEVTRKASGTSQISDYSLVGSAGAGTYGDAPVTLTWTDGAPTATGSATTGTYVPGISNGYKIIVPADTVARQLVIYAGGWSSGGTLTAHLSDGSAADFVDSSYSSMTGQYQANYTLSYHAATAGQTLAVTWVQNAGSNGNVVLDGAALAGGH